MLYSETKNKRKIVLQVTLVKWNEPYQKLATCDSSGIIFVWIKYEGRWSIELINDRNTAVTHFCWSHDGRMALICYQVKKLAYVLLISLYVVVFCCFYYVYTIYNLDNCKKKILNVNKKFVCLKTALRKREIVYLIH